MAGLDPQMDASEVVEHLPSKPVYCVVRGKEMVVSSGDVRDIAVQNQFLCFSNI